MQKRQFMSVIRSILLACSALALVTIVGLWTVSGRAADVLLLTILAFLATNTVYIFFSRPALRTSTIFGRVATGLAIASLKLQHQAGEAQLREAEAERLKKKEAEFRRQKLQAAEEFLLVVRKNPVIGRNTSLDVRQIAGSREPTSAPNAALSKPRLPQPARSDDHQLDTPALPRELSPAAPPKTSLHVEG
jgi:hypothetical protein